MAMASMYFMSNPAFNTTGRISPVNAQDDSLTDTESSLSATPRPKSSKATPPSNLAPAEQADGGEAAQPAQTVSDRRSSGCRRIMKWLMYLVLLAAVGVGIWAIATSGHNTDHKPVHTRHRCEWHTESQDSE
ncbi:hypothetical protein E4U41_007050 [Claviceps citrina]|nr:hypothetical protein E4U41_007050 [Claviceps citrina]